MSRVASARREVDTRSRVEKARDLGDTMPKLAKAGMTWAQDGENAGQCLQYEKDPRNIRPPTPQEQVKYRNSYQHQPGLRLVHVGQVDDKQFHPQGHRHGIRTKKGGSVQACFSAGDSELVNHLTEAKEKIYKSHTREPLGHTYKRGHKFTDECYKEDFAFGKPSTHSAPVKGLMYYEDLDGNNILADEIKRHLTTNTEREITRPLDRKYDWKSTQVDPVEHRFGRKEPLDHNGVAASLKHADETKVADRRQQQVRRVQQDRLGRAREPRGVLKNLGEEFVFGKVEMSDEWGVKKLLSGNYDMVDQMPDKDLGMSIKKLSKIELVPPNPTDRAYGVPSIRFDKPAPLQRSVADAQNYGNESNCKELVFPSRFAFDGVDHEDFVMVRPRDEIRTLFKALGAEFSDQHFMQLCDMAERDFGGLSADSFRHAWNKSRFDTAAPVLSPLAGQTLSQQAQAEQAF